MRSLPFWGHPQPPTALTREHRHIFNIITIESFVQINKSSTSQMATTINTITNSTRTAESCIARANVSSDAVLVVVVHSPGTKAAPRRVRTQPSVSVAELLALLNVPAGSSVRYTDPDGDVCTLGTDAELAEAVRCAAVRKPLARKGAADNNSGVKERLVLHVRVHTPPAAAAARAAAATDAATARSSSAATAAPRTGGLGGAAHRAAQVVAAANKPNPAANKPNPAAAKHSPVAAKKAPAVDPAQRAARVAARIAQLEQQLAAVSAAAAACANNKPARSALLVKRQAMLRAKIAELHAITSTTTAAAAAVGDKASTADKTKLSLEQRMAVNAERSAKLSACIDQLQQQASSARADGKLKRATALDERIVKLREQLSKVQQRRFELERSASAKKDHSLSPSHVDPQPKKPNAPAVASCSGVAPSVARNAAPCVEIARAHGNLQLIACIPPNVAMRHLQRVLAMLKLHQAMVDRRIAHLEAQLAKRNTAVVPQTPPQAAPKCKAVGVAGLVQPAAVAAAAPAVPECKPAPASVAAPKGQPAAPKGKAAAPKGKLAPVPAAPKGKAAAPKGKLAPVPAAPKGKPAAPKGKLAPLPAAPKGKPAAPKGKTVAFALG